MKTLRLIPSVILFIAASFGGASAQQKVKLGENAALRYWSAFAQMEDVAITDDQAKELNLILDGTAPYSDLKYRELVEKNRRALETMIRGTALPVCDWGLDYQLGSETPIDFVRKALTLGRLNILYALHLLQTGDKDGAVRTLAAGLRFSHDVANGGTLFASLVTKHLLADHLRVITFALQTEVSAAQRSVLRQATIQLGPDGLDWESNIRRELEIPREAPTFPRGLSPEAKAALARIVPAYVGVLDKPSTLPELQHLIAGAPQSLQKIIPNPKQVVEAKEDLTVKLQRTRSSLQ
jgi:hypothetical protein